MYTASACVGELRRAGQRTRPVQKAQQVEEGHKQHQLPVKLRPHRQVLVGRVQLETGDGACAHASARGVPLDHFVGLDAAGDLMAQVELVDDGLVVAVVEPELGAGLCKGRGRLARVQGAAAAGVGHGMFACWVVVSGFDNVGAHRGPVPSGGATASMELAGAAATRTACGCALGGCRGEPYMRMGIGALGVGRAGCESEGETNRRRHARLDASWELHT